MGGDKLKNADKRILHKLSNNDGLGISDLADSLDEPKSTVSNRCSYLKDNDYIVDKNFKPNKSDYMVKDGVKVYRQTDMVKIINRGFATNVFESVLLVVALLFFDADRLFILGFAAAFCPSLVLNMYTMFSNMEEGSEIIVKK